MSRHWLRNSIGLRNLVGALGVAASALLFAGQVRASGLELEQVPFRSFAHELLLGIGAADLSDLAYYRSFNSWKTACILHGVYARYRAGRKSAEGVDVQALYDRILLSLDRAAEFAAEVG